MRYGWDWFDVVFAVLMAGLLGFFVYAVVTADDREPDPCEYIVMAGKVPVTAYHHGHIRYGGREVICP